METTRSISTAMQPGDWALSMDLKDAKFPHPDPPGLPKALPFGLAPLRIFTMVARAFVAPFHALGMNLYDWLLRCSSNNLLKQQLQVLKSKAALAGWIINEEKFTPARDFVFVVVRFVTNTAVMVPPQDRLEKISKLVLEFRNRPSVTARIYLQLLGLLNSEADQIPYGRIYMRPLQLLLLSHWRPLSDPLKLLVPLPDFWGSYEKLSIGMPLTNPSP
jgi:hypothetical protein